MIKTNTPSKDKSLYSNKALYLLALILFISFFPLFFSCSQNPENEQTVYINFGQNGMNAGYEYIVYPFENLHPVSVKPHNNIADSAFFQNNQLQDIYHLYFLTRFTEKCKVSSLKLNYEIGSLNSDTILKDTLVINLYDPQDISKGKGNFGIYEIKTPLIERVKNDENFFVAFSTDEKDTKGIISLGVMYEKL